jgi:catechol 2,3-dioxygenase-like lactoylglutathione lyase family enzyme
MTRRQFAIAIAGGAATRLAHSDQPLLAVSGLDHLKIRTADVEASAMFYRGLFAGDIIAVLNSTFPDRPWVGGYFLKLGDSGSPFLMLEQTRSGEQPALDHLALLTSNLDAARSSLTANGVRLINPNQGVWFHDPDGALIELAPWPMWGIQADSMRFPIPAHLQDIRPAFEGAVLQALHLRTSDVDRSTAFYARWFGPTPLQFRKGAAQGLARLVIAIRNLDRSHAARLLQQRGIEPDATGGALLLRDPDGNEIELVTALR